MSTSPPRRGKAFPPKSPDELDLRRVVDTIPQLVWSAFPDGSVEFCNQRWLECTGLTAEQAQGWGWRAAIHPEDLDELAATWRRVLAEGVPGEAVARMQMADGTFRWFLIRATPLRDDKGQIVRWYGTNTDIDERKRAEEALRESEQRFRLVADTAPVLIWMSGTDKLCTYFNKPWLDFTGRSMEKELGNGWAEGVHPEDLQRCLDTYTQSFDRRDEFRVEYRLRRHDGEYRWVFDIGVPRFNNNGSFAGYIGSCVDVTDRQLALRETALTNDRLRLAMEAGTSVWWDLDVKSGRDLWFGDLQTVFGIESDKYAASAEDFIRYVHPDDRQQVSEALADARQNRKLYAAEFRIVRPDGKVRWLVARGKFYYATNGDPERMLGILLDITDRKRTEEALSLTNDRLRLAMEAGGAGGWEWDIKSGRNLWFGKAYALVGTTPEAYSGSIQEFWDRVHTEDRIRLHDAVENAKQNNTEFNEEFRVMWPDGTVRWLRSQGKYFYAANGEPERMLGISVDITERKRAEEAFRQSELRYKEVFDNTSECIFLLDVTGDGRFKFAGLNPAEEAAVGFSSAAVAGRFVEDVAGDEVAKGVIANYRRCVEVGTLIGYEEELNLPIGRRYFHTNLIPVRDAAGRIHRIVGVARDITERKGSLEALRASEERLRLAIQAGRMYAYEWDVATDAVVRSPECTDILGVGAPTRTTRQQLLAFIHLDERGKFTDALSEVTPENPTIRLNYRVLRSDGSVIWLEKTARAFFDREGRTLRMIGIVADVTDRKQAEEARFKHAAVVESSDDAIISKNLEGVIVSWNTGAQRIFGFTEAEAVGQPITIIIPPELREEENTILQRLRAGEHIEHHETIRVTKEGKKVNVSLTICPLKDSTGKIIGASKIARNITEVKQTQDKLRESEERLRLAVETGRMYAFEWDPTTDLIVRSGECADILSWTDDPTHDSGRQFVARVHPDDRERYTATTETGLTAENPTYQTSYRVLRPDGSVIWLEESGRAFFDAQGRMLRLIGMGADVTERKRAEEVLSGVSRKLIEAQEQERTRIARDLHDDIGQRLALLAIELEQLETDLPSSSIGILSRMDELRKQTSEISTDVQTLAHELHSSKLEYLGIAAAMKSFCNEFGEQQKLEIDFTQKDIPRTVPQEISLCLFRVLQEALHNAVKHSGVRHFEVELRGASDAIHLTMRDLGLGFDPEAAMKGRGLGLTSMEERLKLMDGELLIDSKPNQGTTIHARVPLTAARNSARAAG